MFKPLSPNSRFNRNSKGNRSFVHRSYSMHCLVVNDAILASTKLQPLSLIGNFGNTVLNLNGRFKSQRRLIMLLHGC